MQHSQRQTMIGKRMNIHDYLKRIEYGGSLEPTLDTLRAVHRQHLLTIPYENLDIHLGRKLELNEPYFFEKLVLENVAVGATR